MTRGTQRRLLGIAALSMAAAALGFLAKGDLGDNLVYYWSPSELMEAPNAKDAVVRLGGLVASGSYSWDRDAQRAEFDVTDGTTEVRVVSDGNPPQMFREGIGVVVEGTLRNDGQFYTQKVMVKHSNEYQAPDGEGYDMPSMNTLQDDT